MQKIVTFPAKVDHIQLHSPAQLCDSFSQPLPSGAKWVPVRSLLGSPLGCSLGSPLGSPLGCPLGAFLVDLFMDFWCFGVCVSCMPLSAQLLMKLFLSALLLPLCFRCSCRQSRQPDRQKSRLRASGCVRLVLAMPPGRAACLCARSAPCSQLHLRGLSNQHGTPNPLCTLHFLNFISRRKNMETSPLLTTLWEGP